MKGSGRPGVLGSGTGVGGSLGTCGPFGSAGSVGAGGKSGGGVPGSGSGITGFGSVGCCSFNCVFSSHRWVQFAVRNLHNVPPYPDARVQGYFSC